GGKSIKLAERPVEIHGLEVLRYDYPELQLLVRCGSGTYVRSLGRDLARAVGTDCIMSALHRQRIGPFRAEDAVAYKRLTLELVSARLLPPLMAVGDLPTAAITEAEARRLIQGQPIANRWAIAAAEAMAIGESGQLVAIVMSKDDEQLWPVK